MISDCDEPFKNKTSLNKYQCHLHQLWHDGARKEVQLTTLAKSAGPQYDQAEDSLKPRQTAALVPALVPVATWPA